MSLKSFVVMGIASAVATLAGTASAQEAIATAGGSPVANAPVSTASDPLRLPNRIDRGGDILRSRSPCGAPPKADGSPDRSPHGEVFASAGSRGYREGGGIVCVPIGDAFSATVAVDAARINGQTASSALTATPL